MKKSFLKKNFSKLLKLKEEQRQVSHDEVYTVAIVTNEAISESVDIPSKVEEILGLENIKLYKYRPFRKNDIPTFKYFTEKDFNWKGKIKSKRLQNFCDEPFDLLIAYFHQPNLYAETVVLHSNAAFKVGFAKVNQSLFDIEISEHPFQVDRFLIELKKYLIILQKL